MTTTHDNWAATLALDRTSVRTLTCHFERVALLVAFFSINARRLSA
jgi:hypothetical protein